MNEYSYDNNIIIHSFGFVNGLNKVFYKKAAAQNCAAA